MCFQRRFLFNFSHFEYFSDPGSHLEWLIHMKDTKLVKKKHPMTIPAKFGTN
jgi:hypothetical protein